MDISDIVEGIKEKSNTYADPSTHGVDSIFLREATSTIGKIAEALLGVFIMVIIIMVPLIVSLEICYICFPLFRSSTDKVIEKINTSGVAKRATEFTLRDAIQAIIQAETAETGRSALWIYFKIKCKSIMFIVFVVALMLMGSGTIINVITNLFSGVFEMIGSMLS